ncbi:unnamed protein product [Mytilus coruscus]|uniref:MEGF10_11 n=1 Tax=Mytilus coruscus TaxID=42192 RepID=A0A6J8EJU0_MYTCO|nr:unnamed protein product [Mytilus coruscus]
MQTYVIMVLIKECTIGYTSSKGEPCTPCSGKKYGYQCADKCLFCTAYQRCDHIHGCINVTTKASTQLSDLEYNATAVMDLFDTHTANVVDRYEVFVRRAIYTACIGCACIFGSVLTGILVYKWRKRRTSHILSRNAHTDAIQHPTENSIDSFYEEIDDIALSEPAQRPNLNNINEELSSICSSSSDKNSISTTEEQYLNPYQIIVQSSEDRPYSVIERSEREIRNISCKTESVIKEKYEKELDEQEGHKVKQIDFASVQYHPLNYSEIEFINKTDTCINNSNIFENTEIVSNQATAKPCLKENTEYVDIVHIV